MSNYALGRVSNQQRIRTNLFNKWRDEESGPVIKRAKIAIIAKYLIPGYRYLRPGEEILFGDLFWSVRQKCYLPEKHRRGWRGTLAGTLTPWIREIEDGDA